MKRPYLPALLLAFAAAGWLGRQHTEGRALRHELERLRAVDAPSPPAAATRVADPGDDAATLREQIEKLQRELAAVEHDATNAARKLAETRQHLPAVENGETVVSLGRITDMGQETAQAIRGITAFLQQRPDEPLSKDQVQASFMKLVTWMPEIAGFEERPAEMASFQAAVLRNLLDLDEPRARQVESILAQHFTALHAARLTAAHASEPAWRERRSTALTPLLWQLRPFIPATFKSPQLVGPIVNIGAGLETKTETHLSKEPGKSSHSVSVSLPTWPAVPWAPPKAQQSQ